MLWSSWAKSCTSTRVSTRLLSNLRGLKRTNVQLTPLPARNIHTASRTTSRVLNNLSPRANGLWTQKRPLSGVVKKQRAFDPRFFSSNASSASVEAAELPVLSPPPVAMWLLGSSALVFAVIVVGGVTRLTESGLSITEWRPVAGTLPPLSQAEWEEEFEKYKRTPEFKL